MDPHEIYRRYQELQRYVGWSDEDAARVQCVAPLVESHFPELIDDFYSEIERHPEARKVITGGKEQIARLKGTLIKWLKELVAGRYDADYVARRWRVGLRHVEIGLNQVYTNAALSRLRRGLLDVIGAEWRGDAAGLLQLRRSMNMLLDLDLALIEDAYQTEYQRRQQAAERLAIGQTMAALAHESRNALQRSKACLEMLAIDVQDRPAALDLVERTQRAQERLQQLYEEVRQYASPIKLECAAGDLGAIWREAWENLAHVWKPKSLRLHEEHNQANGKCRVDRVRLGQVMLNVLENAIHASPQRGEITIECKAAQIGDRDAVEITIGDQGPGLAGEARERIFEPFFTTKAKGTGLGMTIVQRIVEAHGGRVAVNTAPGTRIVITLPREQT